MIPLAIGLASLGAVCFALGARKQHGAVSPVAAGSGMLRIGQLFELVRQRTWLIGVALATAGATLHVVALALAPVSVVQPIGVLALPIAVLLGARAGGWQLPVPAVTGTTASVAGVVGFVALAASRIHAGPIPDGAELRVGAIAAGVVAGLGAVATVTRGYLRCLAFATGAGVAFGLVSTLLRAGTQRLAVADGSWYDDPTVLGSLVGIAAGLLAGGWLVQQGFASGPPELVIGCLTVIDPLVAVGLGIGVLGESVSATPTAIAGGLVCAGLAIAGVFLLARHHPEVADRVTHPDGRTP